MAHKFFIIDGSALVHRSYFAFMRNPLYNSKGENTGAVYGYTNSLLKILEEYEPSHIVVCFDTSAPTFRHERFAEYKATREKMEPEMRNQLPTVYEVTCALGISIVELEGFEADDIMGALAREATKKGHSVYLFSEDKDLLQLVDERTVVISPGRMGAETVVYDVEKVRERFDVPPDKLADVLALAGDKVDNVPGIEGIGLKGAAKLVQTFGSVEELLNSSSQIEKEKLRERIEKSSKELLLFKELVTIRVDTPIHRDMDSLALGEKDVGRLRDLFTRLEFFSLMKRLNVQTELSGDYTQVRKSEDLPEIDSRNGRVGLYVLRSSKDEVGGIAMSLGEGNCLYIAHSVLRKSSRILEWVNSIVSSPDVVKVGEDIKAFIRYLSTLGVRVAGPIFDTSVVSYLLDPDRRDHGLVILVERELGFSLPDFEKEAREDKKPPKELFDKEIAVPSCSRADGALRIYGSLEQKLGEDGLLDLYTEVESPLTAVLADIEEVGVLIDIDFFNKMSQTLAEDLNRTKEEIYDLAGERFNINSSKQLATILFDKLGLPYGKRTKTGYSTSQDLLEKLSLEHELPGHILEYREIYKLKSTYVDTLPGLVSKKTGRIHTTFNQAVAATGRLSSSDPNLQNIPMRTELGREIRKGFLAGEGNVLLSLDYSQVELRILAHLAGEERLKKAYQAGEDIHRETAALVFGVKPEEVTGEMRNTAKMVNYGLVYGMSAYGLSQRLGISAGEAKEFVDAYFDSLPGVKRWIDSTLDSVREKGYTTTLLGRRRYFRDIKSSDHNRRDLAERAAVNSPIQGSAADMIKVAMVAIHGELAAMNTEARMIIQIHDELLFEVPDTDAKRISLMARERMQNAIQLDVPVEVEIGRGSTWYDAHHQ